MKTFEINIPDLLNKKNMNNLDNQILDYYIYSCLLSMFKDAFTEFIYYSIAYISFFVTLYYFLLLVFNNTL